MSDNDLLKQKSLAVQIAGKASDSEKAALKTWIEGMLEIRESIDSPLTKIQKAVTLTVAGGVILPIIRMIARELTPAGLTELTDGLSEIQTSDLSSREKVRRATLLTYTKVREVAWDDRGLAARTAMVGAIAGLVVFGTQAAGIAALGTAIAVPLWVIFGAGGAFLVMLYEKITGKRFEGKGRGKATYTVIDAEKTK